MLGRTLGTIALATLVAWPLGAQRRPGGGGGGRGGFGGTGGPSWWASASGGYQWSNIVNDPQTKSVWNFDANWTVRGTLERVVAPQTTIGVAWTYARMPVGVQGVSGGVCQPCLGDATISTYGLALRSGGGPALHLLYEGFIGATQYGHFSLEGAGATSFSTVKNTDFTWAFGGGFGYSMARDFALEVMYDYANSVHEKSGDLFQRRTTRHYSLRTGVRVGL